MYQSFEQLQPYIVGEEDNEPIYEQQRGVFLTTSGAYKGDIQDRFSKTHTPWEVPPGKVRAKPKTRTELRFPRVVDFCSIIRSHTSKPRPISTITSL